MGKYVLVETRDPFESVDARTMYELAVGLAAEKNEVTVFLVQNAVLATRKTSSAASELADVSKSATVLADDFSLRERGIGRDELVDGVRTASIDDLVDLAVGDSRKIIWH
jgi:sulfur relay protein TusB/DsrH